MQKKKRKREELDKEEENGDNKESDQSTHAFNTSTTPHVYAVPELNMRSHTGFLTFCRKAPSFHKEQTPLTNINLK